jgi:hypothetical protein
MAQQEQEHWLAKYASNYHAWKKETLDGKQVYMRPLGLVEFSFDTDGSDYGGRADMNGLLALEIRHTLSKDEIRRRIALAWANLRLQHVMLQSRVHDDSKTGKRHFVIDLHDTLEDILEETSRSIVWLEDLYPSIDGNELHRHCLNVGRILDPSQCLSRLHVLPLIPLPNGNFELRFLIIMAHQISDGLSAYSWFTHFIRILNISGPSIEHEINQQKSANSISTRLPPAQEDLYPPIAGSLARQRWFWAMMRVLRHIRKPLPETFTNPLRRATRNASFTPLPPTFDRVFDYSPAKAPPMNAFHIAAFLSSSASTRLISLCREANVSIGAGCFALAGISMMELHEASSFSPPSSSSSPSSVYLPFSASFPLNPRSFFAQPPPADSCMLSFSDGITMPFLPSSLPIAARFRLTAKQANRQLRVYQKRLKTKELSVEGDRSLGLGPHSLGRLLANGYLFQIERVESKLPPARRTGINPQGQLPVKMFMGGATCGVSSVGSTASYFRAGQYDLDEVKPSPSGGQGTKDFAADFRNLKMAVRARDNEFLIGSSTDWRGIVSFGVSYDGNAISEEAAERWADKIRGLLEDENVGRARM